MFKLEISEHARKIIDSSLAVYKEANPFRYTDNKKYTQILTDFYKEETIRRTLLLKKVSTDPELIKTVLMHCKKREYFIDFMVDWCWTYDPRLPAYGLPASIPWIPWQQQVDFIEWAYDRYLNQEPGLVDKSRDQGVTWLFCVIFLFEWRWTEGFAGGMGSNKLDNVDKKDDPDCIFEKIRGIIKLLPNWWMPESFDPNKHDKLGSLINKEMGSHVAGQGGLNIGRGGRRSWYLIDEYASLENPAAADAALSQNTNCQFDLSTPLGMNAFGQKRHSGKIKVFTFHWKNDPRKDENWYQHEKARLDPVIVAQEIDINYQASVEGLMIKHEHIMAAVDLKLSTDGERGAGLDVAAGGSNKSSLAFRFGPVAKVEAFNIENAIDLTHIAIELCNKAMVDYLNFDKIGVGHAVYSSIERTEREIYFNHYGIEAGDAPSDLFYKEFDRVAKDIFYNARTEWWYIIARRFEKTWEHVNGIRHYEDQELISIPNNPQLISQLASPKKFITETGKIKLESKAVMLKRGIQSGDEADSVVMAFCGKAGGKKHIMGEYDFRKNVKDVGGKKVKGQHYGALVVDPDLKVYFMCAKWDEYEGTLLVYDEFVMDFPDPNKIADNVILKMQLFTNPLDKLIGGPNLFDESKKTLQKQINTNFWDKVSNYQTVKLKPAKRFDDLGSASSLMNLVSTRKINIDINCKEIQRSFYSWRLESGKFQSDGMRKCILLIVSELMTTQSFKTVLRELPAYRKVGEDKAGVAQNDMGRMTEHFERQEELNKIQEE